MYRSLAIAFIASTLRRRGSAGGAGRRRRSRSAGGTSTRGRSESGRGLRRLLAAVPLENAGRRELPELVADHVLRDVDRDELPSVVDRDRVTDHVRNDHRTTGPRLDDLLFTRVVQRRHLLGEVVVHERSLLDGTRHFDCLLSLGPPPAHDEAVGPLVAPRLEALRFPAPRRGGVAAARGLPLATAHRVIHRIHRDAAIVRPPA